MYWEVMRRAADRGCRLFDFGRSKLAPGRWRSSATGGSGADLQYRYKLKPGERFRPQPAQPKYALFIAAWKRLPLPVANAVGRSSCAAG